MTIKPSQRPRLPAALASVDALFVESEDAIEDSLIKGADFELNAKYVELLTSKVDGVQLTGLNLDQPNVVDVAFRNCELSGVELNRASFTRVDFYQCRMSGFDASELRAQDVTFNECKLDAANFRMTRWNRCEFIDCDLTQADFGNAHLENVRFQGCLIKETHFDHANCTAVSLEGSRLESITGIDGLRGVIIGDDQVFQLARTALRQLGLEVQQHNQSA